MKDALARNLARLSAATGGSQAAVAATLGVSPAAVSEWELARKLPRTETLDLLAAHYGITRDALLAEHLVEAELAALAGQLSRSSSSVMSRARSCANSSARSVWAFSCT